MAKFRKSIFISALAMAAVAVGAQGQDEASLWTPVMPGAQSTAGAVVPATTVDEELQRMSTQAGVIFAGEVTAVRPQVQEQGSGWVEVEFRVEEAIRGCVDQTTYKLREWAGLWTGGLARYRVGQRLLMFLHTPSASGLSSPVGGQDGAIPISGNGFAPSATDVFTDSGEQAVDLRWIETRVVRTASARTALHGGPMAPNEPVLVGREQRPMETRKHGVPGVRSNQRESGRLGASGVTQLPVEYGGAVNPIGTSSAQTTPLRGVVAMLMAWEAQQGR